MRADSHKGMSNDRALSRALLRRSHQVLYDLLKNRPGDRDAIAKASDNYEALRKEAADLDLDLDTFATADEMVDWAAR
jgi:hypothetical protein